MGKKKVEFFQCRFLKMGMQKKPNCYSFFKRPLGLESIMIQLGNFRKKDLV